MKCNKYGSIIGRYCAQWNTIIANPYISATRKYIHICNWTWV